MTLLKLFQGSNMITGGKNGGVVGHAVESGMFRKDALCQGRIILSGQLQPWPGVRVRERLHLKASTADAPGYKGSVEQIRLTFLRDKTAVSQREITEHIVRSIRAVQGTADPTVTPVT